MSPHEVYNVVGVRADASRRVICQHVPRYEAIRVKEMLEDIGIFESIEIEPPDAPALALGLRSSLE